MADPKDLREFTDQEITDEVTRRRALIDESKCTHCEEHWQNCRCYLSSDEGMVQNQPPERGQATSQGWRPHSTLGSIDFTMPCLPSSVTTLSPGVIKGQVCSVCRVAIFTGPLQ